MVPPLKWFQLPGGSLGFHSKLQKPNPFPNGCHKNMLSDYFGAIGGNELGSFAPFKLGSLLLSLVILLGHLTVG